MAKDGHFQAKKEEVGVVPGGESKNAPSMTRHGDNFVALRLIAAILVIYGHAFALTAATGPGFLGNGIQTVALKIFFVISGYLIAESWIRDRSLYRYFARRLLRIIPGLAVLVFSTALIVGPIVTSLSTKEYFSHYDSIIRYFKNILLYPIYNLPGLFSENPYPHAVNGSLWTLPVEFLMYISVPIVMFSRIGKHLILIVCAALAFGAIYVSLQTVPPIIFYGTNLINVLELAPYFFIGAVYKIWINRRYLNLQLAFVIVLLAPLAVQWGASAELLLMLILPYSVLAFGFTPAPIFARLERFGDISYGVYLYAFFVQQIFSHYFDLAGKPLVNFVLTVAVVVPVGWLSWHYVERPALRLKPRRSSGPESLVRTGRVM